MKIYPAIDIRDGRCVRLMQGELQRSTDPCYASFSGSPGYGIGCGFDISGKDHTSRGNASGVL